MAKMFQEEKSYPDNAARKNFVFFAYPFTPAIPQDDYNAVVAELQTELGLRLWYFLDEVTTAELMRKIWRAILRCDLAVFDISKGNPNVAFELGLAVCQGKPCITMLKTGELNPLGGADLGYSERAEYTSRETLKDKLRQLLVAKSNALRLWNTISYEVQHAGFGMTREQLENAIRELVKTVFQNKKIAKPAARVLFGDNDANATTVLDALRQHNVLKVEGAKKGAYYVFTDEWVYHDHEVVGA